MLRMLQVSHLGQLFHLAMARIAVSTRLENAIVSQSQYTGNWNVESDSKRPIVLITSEDEYVLQFPISSSPCESTAVIGM
ncbi:hypothetical protein BDQ17DRAFT_1340272 [Cyathus striatus]|nr:hypothetical protein BDQ17DRAFT_1340272 [Cyathus striatus]